MCMFMATLITIATIWKQPKYPLIDEWVKIWCSLSLSLSLTHTHTHTHDGILLSHQNEILRIVSCLDLENYMLNDIS